MKNIENDFSFSLEEFQEAMSKLGVINTISPELKKSELAFAKRLFNSLSNGNNSELKFSTFSLYACQLFDEGSEGQDPSKSPTPNTIPKELKRRLQSHLVGASPISKKNVQVYEDPELTFKPKLVKGRREYEVLKNRIFTNL